VRPPFRKLMNFGFSFGPLALSLLLLAISTLLSMPWLIRSAGDSGWATIAAGQSAGVIASVGIMYGWSITGPSQVARASLTAANDEYLTSVLVRALLCVPFIAGAVGVTLFVNGGDIGLTVISVVSTALLGVRGGWYFLGRNRPWLLFSLEAVPRSVGIWVGVYLITTLNLEAWTAIATQAAGVLVAGVVSAFFVLGHDPRPITAILKNGLRIDIRSVLRSRRHGVVAALTSATFGASPLLLVNLVAPSAAAEFSLIARVQAQAMTALSPAGDYLHGWVPRSSDSRRFRRAVAALSSAAAVGSIAGAMLAVFGTHVYGYLGGGVVTAAPLVTIFAGALLAVAFMVQVSGPAILPALGKTRQLSRNVLVGSITGLVLVPALAIMFGAEGAIVGWLFGLSVTLTANLITSFRARPTGQLHAED
jgi:O-antigen/teichoic acid export membrane protein